MFFGGLVLQDGLVCFYKREVRRWVEGDLLQTKRTLTIGSKEIFIELFLEP